MRRRSRIDPLNAAASLAFMVVLATPAAADNFADVSVEQLMLRADTGHRQGILEPDRSGGVPTGRYMAVETLARIVPTPPTSADVPIGEEDQYVAICRRWWERNRAVYP